MSSHLPPLLPQTGEARLRLLTWFDERRALLNAVIPMDDKAISTVWHRLNELEQLAPFIEAIRSAGSAQAERPPCSGCGGPHPFDTTVPSVRWNAVIRKAGLPEYLCLTCIVSAFVKAGESFTAELIGGEHNFEPIEIRTRPLKTVADLHASMLTVEQRKHLTKAQDIVLYVRRGVWHSSEVAQVLAEWCAAFSSDEQAEKRT